MKIDLGLSEVDGLYALTAPVEDVLVRVRNRWTVQFLSTYSDPRGCVLVSEMAAERVKTNADVVNLYALSSSVIISAMRLFAEDLIPTRAELLSFDFLNTRTLRLRDRLVTTEGSITAQVLVETTT